MKQEKKKQLLKKALQFHHVGDLNSADKIYLTSAVAEGDNQDAADVHRELRVICFSANNGKKLWDTKVFDQKPLKRPIHHKNSHASPTAIVDNDRIYVHFGHMGLARIHICP